ncbi:MAG: YeeE/YedE thiosulfate transporter family protein [Candidatus Eisenbacteria bacterium]
MNAPFFKFGAFGDETSLVVAFVIGIAFGWFLERAGFGSAKKLVSQFYLDDLAVFKVMFTAIVTAMLGAFYLGWIGVLDLSLVYLTPTNLWPQIAGGLVLGFGFIIGGYCPGTSMVGAATGRIDAMVYVLGVAAGTFLTGEAFPLLKTFYESGAMGRLTLPEVLHLPYGVVVLLVVLMALGGFAGAEWLERRARDGAAKEAAR